MVPMLSEGGGLDKIEKDRKLTSAADASAQLSALQNFRKLWASLAALRSLSPARFERPEARAYRFARRTTPLAVEGRRVCGATPETVDLDASIPGSCEPTVGRNGSVLDWANCE